MPFESSMPLVVGCVLAAVVALVAWLRMQAGWLLVTAALLAVGGAGAFLIDRLVVTDREYIRDLFPRLARAAEQGDVPTIMAALDQELRSLRDDAERALKQVRPTEIVITTCDVAVDARRNPPTATADLIARVTGNMIDKNTPGTALVGVKATLRKQDGGWLVTDAEVVPVRPGATASP